jgi:putative polyhydroxyalkanoate system protein
MMAVKKIERAYPGKSASELYGEAEKILRRLGEKYGIACQFDAAGRTIVVPEKMGVKGVCTISDGLVRVELTHGLLGGAVVGQVKSYIEQKLDGIFG